ncbi:YitT family protein [Pseudohalocynthiibacter aestuariivivens]|uniref:YitT family protein n=1 Tax=Pseudohalocynthiibacter aestuariivivens TaxID=1591409 RepID=A0ABV5JJE5_9RHOB
MGLKLSFLSIKKMPNLFWSSPKALTIAPPLISVVFLVIGLILFGLGEALIIAAGVGVSPWIVFAQGITIVTGWSIGFATFIISLFVLFCWIPLRQTPGIGTILNAIIIALVLDFSLPYLPTYDSLALKVSEAMTGILVTGFGGGLYLIANLGAGPRDGLMTGLQTLTNLPIAWVRSGLELSVVSVGWALGGSVGIGTVLFALGIGPAVAASMYGLESVFSRPESGV